MPIKADGESLLRPGRRRRDGHALRHGKGGDEARRRREDQPRFARHPMRRRKVGQARGDTPTAADGVEREIDRRTIVVGRADDDMGMRGEAIEVERAEFDRVQAQHLLPEQRAAQTALRRRARRLDRAVQAPVDDMAQIGGVAAHHFDRNAWGERLKPGEKRRQQHDAFIVKQSDPDAVGRGRGVEAGRGQQLRHAVQPLGQIRRDGLSPRSQKVIAARANQKRVPQIGAELRQDAAHRRLADADRRGRPADMPQPQQRLQSPEMIEVREHYSDLIY